MQQAAGASSSLAATSSSGVSVGASRAPAATGSLAASTTTPAVPHAANSWARRRGAIAVASASQNRRLQVPSPPRAAPDTAAREQWSSGRVQRGAPRKPPPSSSSSNAPSPSRRRERSRSDADAADADDDLASAFARLRPVGPPPVFPSAAPTGKGLDGGGGGLGRPGPRIGDYAAAVVAAGFLPGDERADPRLVKPLLHPSNLVRGSGGNGGSNHVAAASEADVAAAEREMEAMAGFGEDEELLDEIDGLSSPKSRRRKKGGARRGGREEPQTGGALANALAELNTPDDDVGAELGDGIDNFGGFSKMEDDDEEDDDDEDGDEGAAAAARRPWVEAASPWNDDDDDDESDDDDDEEEEEEEEGDLRAYLPPSASSPSSSSSAPVPTRRTGGSGGGAGGGRFRVMALNVESGGGGNFFSGGDFLDRDDGFDDGSFFEEEYDDEEGEREHAAAAVSHSPSDDSMIDLITGERLASLPAAAAAATAGASAAPHPSRRSGAASAAFGGDDEDEGEERRRAEERRAFDAAFCAASEALQCRLVLGVRAEADAAARQRAALYRRNSVRELRAEGAVLAGLVATPAGEAFGRAVFALSLPREGGRASEAVEAAAAALARGERPPVRQFQRPPKRRGSREEQGEEEAAAAEPAAENSASGEELPYHRFGKRDPVILAPVRLSDPTARPLSGGQQEAGQQPRLLTATVLDVWPDHLVVSVSADAAEFLESQQQQRNSPSQAVGWRVDADQPDTTTARQLAAVGMVGRPFAEVYGVSAAEAAREAERLGERAAEMTRAEIERSARRRRQRQRRAGPPRGGGGIGGAAGGLAEAAASAFDEGMDRASPPSSSPWTPGELRVRSILLGDPDSRAKAAELPPWARHGAWQLAASRLLASGGPGVAGLNASQRAAISSALTSTVTLWQGPPGTGKTRTLVALLTVLAKAARRESYAGIVAEGEGGGGEGGGGEGGGEEKFSRDEVEEALREAGRCTPVLACGDTNAAADGLALGLAAAGVRVVRLGAPPVRSAALSAKGRKSGDGDGARDEAVLATLSLEAIAARTPKGKQAAAARAAAARAAARARAAAAAEAAAAPPAASSGDGATPQSSQASEARRLSGAARREARDLRAEAERLEAEAADQVLLLAEVVCSTTATAGDERRLGPNARFRCVVLDEATQATEPSTLIPLVRGCEACVLAGDPRQLPPTVTSAEAKGSGLQQTLFERVMRSGGGGGGGRGGGGRGGNGSGNGGGLEPILLDTQYRMHPALSRFPSAAFYGDRLKDGELVLGMEAPPSSSTAGGGGFPWPAPGVPLAFVDADDCRERRGNEGGGGSSSPSSAGGSSLTNPGEATLALRSAALLLQEKVRQEEEEEEEAERERARLLLEVEAAGGGEEEVAAAFAAAAAAEKAKKGSSSSSSPPIISSVAILAPYAGQIRLLRAELRMAPPRLRSKVTVSTIDGFQGREADAVVLSTVRSNGSGSLGFVADPRRVNVALTRARRALVVVGAPSTLAGGSPNAVGVWRDWLDFVSELGAFLPGGALPLAPWEQRDEKEEEDEHEQDWEAAAEPRAAAAEASSSAEGDGFDTSSSFSPQQFISSPPLDDGDGGAFPSSFGDTAGSVLEWGDVEEEF